MTNIEILRAYSNGEITLDNANKELRERKAPFHLDPQKNLFTPEEILNGSAGLLDSGSGSFDKVMIDPETMELINCDMGESYAMCIVKGQSYEVKGKKLVKL